MKDDETVVFVNVTAPDGELLEKFAVTKQDLAQHPGTKGWIGEQVLDAAKILAHREASA